MRFSFPHSHAFPSECEQPTDGAVREPVDYAVVVGWPPEAATEAIKRAAARQAWPITKIPIRQMTRSKRARRPAWALLMAVEVDCGRSERHDD